MEKEQKIEYKKLLFYLSVCGLTDTKPQEQYIDNFDTDTLYKLAKAHSIIAIVYRALQKINTDSRYDLSQWQEASDKTLRKNILLDVERSQLFAWMNENKIWHMPLKGVILKDLYPIPGLRQMADNDILFDKNRQKEVYDWFMSRDYEGEMHQAGSHDAYLKPPIYNFEMHTALFSDAADMNWRPVFDIDETHLVRDNADSYAYHFGDEDFYIYMVAHEYKHYNRAGTGIRSLLDRYVYLSWKETTMDWNYIHSRLEMVELAEFESKTRLLVQRLIQDAEAVFENTLSQEEQVILDRYLKSGTYGTIENQIAGQLKKKSAGEKITILSRVKVLFSYLFPDAKKMRVWCNLEAKYAVKFPILLPIAYIHRIVGHGLMNLRQHGKKLKYILKYKE